jgi:phosphoadenosine phosphosulfate reductase
VGWVDELGRHGNDGILKILQFSGGKDSLACLLLLKDQLHDITVVWADSGDAFPETHEQMQMVRAMCPNFVVAQGDAKAVIEKFGYPTDLLPVSNHSQVMQLSSQDKLPLQGYLECCVRSFLEPMHKKTLELGATMIIRGQKACDKKKAPIKSGDVVNGITYWFPLEHWTDEQVMEYVEGSPLLPLHYATANTSLDCMHCTAYLSDNAWKLPYLKRNHPTVATEVLHRLNEINDEIESEYKNLKRVLNG